MTLRWRLSLTFAAFTLVVLVAASAVTYVTFARQQDAELRELLERDLARIRSLVANPALGSSFVEAQRGSYVLQFVTSADRVALANRDAPTLPRAAEPALVTVDERRYLAGHAPWGTSGGTIRLAVDVHDALASRATLGRTLALSTAGFVLLAAFAALVFTRRSLAPLGDLARQARLVDPKRPDGVRYRGPEDEVASLARALNDTLADIRARQDAERAFLGEVAHELAAPLTLVSGQLRALTHERPYDTRLSVARAAADELLYTSQDLLTLARGELERPVQLELVSLAEPLERVAGEYPGVALDLRSRGEAVGSPERLVQMIRNLVRNAVQASGGTDGVRVTLDEEGERLVLRVHDHGPGMPPERLERIFERYYSGGSGAGLGLGIARSIAEAHGGAISVESTPGAGSVFTVALPSLASQLESRRGDDRTKEVGTGGSPSNEVLEPQPNCSQFRS